MTHNKYNYYYSIFMILTLFFFLRKEEMIYAPSRGLRAPLECGTLLLTQPYSLQLPSCL